MEQLNPENYGTTELTSSVARDTRGGWVRTAVGVAVTLALSAARNSDDISEGFEEGYEDANQ